MTALERAARAVWDSVCSTNDDKSGGYVGTMRDKPFYVDGFVDHAGIARAVLMAVRDYPISLYVDSYCGEDAHPVENFSRMIDAILNEKDTTND